MFIAKYHLCHKNLDIAMLRLQVYCLLVGNTCSLVTCARQRIQRVFHRLLVALATFDSVSTNFVITKKTIGYVISKDVVSLDFEKLP